MQTKNSFQLALRFNLKVRIEFEVDRAEFSVLVFAMFQSKEILPSNFFPT